MLPPRFRLRLTLRRWPLLILWLLFWPARASALLEVSGLAGVRSQVSLAVDPTLNATLADMERQARFAPVEEAISHLGGNVALWLRIDLVVPENLVGQSVWLEAQPAHLWGLSFYGPDGAVQEAGLRLAHARQSYPAMTYRFRTVLGSTSDRCYLRVWATMTPAMQLTLHSEASLAERDGRRSFTLGLFLGLAGLVVLLSLLYWAMAREWLFGAHALFVMATACFVGALEGRVAAEWLTSSPRALLEFLIWSGTLMIVSTALFSGRFLEVRQRHPRLVRVVWAQAVVAVVAASTVRGSYVHLLVLILMGDWLLVVGLMAYLAVRQALQQRTAVAHATGLSFLAFLVCELVPAGAAWGVIPGRSVAADLLKAAVVLQAVVTHLLLMARLRGQVEARIAADRRAVRVEAEAVAERTRRHELAQFLAMFGHEVRTPLAVIASTTQSLELLPGAELPERRERYGRILEAVDRMKSLATVALSQDRLETRAGAVSPGFTSLRTLVVASVEELGLGACGPSSVTTLPLTIRGQRGGHLRLDLREGETLMRADATLLRVAVTCLLDNARKYADPTSTVELTVRRADGRVMLSVDSRGPVLSETDRVKAFEKYWRGGEHDNVGGAGLGLFLVRRICEGHGGRATVMSLADRITRFTIDLPDTASEERP